MQPGPSLRLHAFRRLVGSDLQQPFCAEVAAMPAVPDAGKAPAGGTLGVEHSTRPLFQISIGRGGGDDAHCAADYRAVELAEVRECPRPTR